MDDKPTPSRACAGDDDACVLRQRIGEHVLLVTLNRPHKRNAINLAAARALADAVKSAESDDSIRAVVLAANGDKAFCSGADLAEVAAGHGRAIDGGDQGLLHAPRKKPWIAAVRGTAMGGGLELALACELIVAGEGASFALPEVKRGLIAGGAGAYRLPRRLPRAIALEMLLTGDPIDAPRAAGFGLVNQVVADDRVLDAALALAERIVCAAPLAVQASLQVARQSIDLSEADLRTLTDTVGAQLSLSEDMQEGVRAFLEKRAPVWRAR